MQLNIVPYDHSKCVDPMLYACDLHPFPIPLTYVSLDKQTMCTVVMS